MAASEHASPPPPEQRSFFDRHYFLLRRLHSLTGIAPIGVFLIEHMFTNSAILIGPEEYQRDVDFIWGLPGLLYLEIFTIWLPLAFHGGLGVVYTFTGKPNGGNYPYQANYRYTAMRISGMIALVFIFVHLAQTRWGWTFGGLYDAPFDPERATETTIASVQYAWWTPWFYLVGTVATIYHFANGLWTAAITWGLTITPNAQRRWGYVCAGVGALLMIAGLASLLKFATMERPATDESAPAAITQSLP